MKTIYSILYVNLNTTLNERVSIGLVVTNGIKNYFKFSADKLLALKGLLNNERHGLIKNYLKSIEKEIGHFNENNSSQLFEKKEFRHNWVNESYLTYLSKYSNNIVQFSLPKSIDVELNSNNFKRIFEKYIFKYSEEIKVTPIFNVHSVVKKQLFPKIEKRVNLEKTLTSNDFDNLFAPIDIDFIGVNGIPVAGQTIDFEKTHYYLENDVTRFVSLTKAIELEGDIRGKYFVLGREPQKKANKNHFLWEQIRDTEFLEFVDVDEVGIIEEYIESNNVRPFFD
ncbi:hypothetical protein K8354_00665 [Polaribacter litorisediminis]|uniref:hypothetical protein n=1 Tax=Polaribacter litorisediminis TaxID=1908341 RepID=UPI001CBFFA7D|nr:hypothetical protein [Polaribacter litorisediminis]UAM98372.1 hypothetical protein K8354_00665 [Polaribacter litorisediminis]